ncbi:MAG TPA: HIT family protein [Gaiellaceae bacterium]|nr:HIT family protein [Gaiellaceae bacterium]
MDCPICARGEPLGIVAELDATWVTTDPDPPVPGYVCVVSKRHVVEPYELPADEMDAFWRECMRVAHAVAELLQPAKMNYEIHGNTLPHLHMHLYPRNIARSREELSRLPAVVGRPRRTGTSP